MNNPEPTTSQTPSSAFAVAVVSSIAFAALVGSLILGDAEPREPVPGIPDPGVLVGWLVPVTSLVADLAAIAVIGFLILAALLMPSGGRDVQGLAVKAAQLARRAAWVWFLATLATLIVTTADVFALSLDEVRGDLIIALVLDSEVGQAIILQAIGTLVLALALRWTIDVRALLGWTGFALLLLLPAALTGHAASGGSHSLASVALYLHLAAVAVWVGGLVGLGWLAAQGSKRLEAAVVRFSGVATVCFAVVGISGVASAMVRATSYQELVASPYGRLVLLKLIAYFALGGFGWWQRRRIIGNGGNFRRLAGNEIMLMVGAVGIAVALSRTPPPAGDVLLTPVENLLGGPMPPTPTLERLLFGIYPSGVGLAVVGFGTAAYVVALWTLRRRGERWPLSRTIAWTVGMVVLAWATTGGLGAYAHAMFSAHLTNQVLLSMIAAPLLVLGAPGILAMKTLPGSRQPGDVSPREVFQAIAASRFVAFLTHPLVMLTVLLLSVYTLYFSTLFTKLMGSLLGHLGMEMYFLVIGVLFHTSLIGSHLIRTRPRGLRVAAAGLTTLLAVWFAIALFTTERVIGAGYWTSLNRAFATDLLADQILGGALMVALALPSLIAISLLQLRRPRSRADEPSPTDRSQHQGS